MGRQRNANRSPIKRQVMNEPPYKLVDKPVKDTRYHLSYANPKCVWSCFDIDEEKQTVTLIAKATQKKLYNIRWEYLRHIRKNENKQ